MIRPFSLLAALAGLNIAALASAQQPPAEPQRIEARKDVRVTVNWTLGDQAWDFKDIQTAYEPVKGYLEPRGNQGTLAVWKLRLIKDLEPGAAKLHEEIRSTPFKVVLLDADRTVIDADAPVGITTVTGKMDDTIELYVTLPEDSKLKQVKFVRVQRRTEIGF